MTGCSAHGALTFPTQLCGCARQGGRAFPVPPRLQGARAGPGPRLARAPRRGCRFGMRVPTPCWRLLHAGSHRSAVRLRLPGIMPCCVDHRFEAVRTARVRTHLKAHM